MQLQTLVALCPDIADAHNILGSIYQQKGDLEEAIASYLKAINCGTDAYMAYNNLGCALRLRGDVEGATAAYRKSLEINPDFPAAMNNLGTALRDQGCLDESIAWYRKAIQLNPDFAEAHWNLSFALLLKGDYEEGWEEYEWIWKLKPPMRNLPQPRWDGTALKGKSILVYAEQGFGDVIQFARYIPLVAEREGTVIVGCQRELKDLLRSVQGVTFVVAFGERVPVFHVQCPLPSLPRLFKTTLDSIPDSMPYLHADRATVEKWKKRIGARTSALKVGLAWAGSAGHLNDYNRSCRLDLFLPIARMPGVQLISLQKEIPPRWASDSLSQLHVLDFMDEVENFLDTAGIIENLDIVISVDTAVAHLAGALGKRVWTLLPYAPDWRWMLHREDSPWYPTMRLFRQPSPGDWKSVIVRVQSVLEDLMGKGFNKGVV